MQGNYTRERILRTRISQRERGFESMKLRHARERHEAERMLTILRAELEYENNRTADEEEL
jgi:hypothetical protein